ncbi:MAG: imidazole glycerol phosphate synthase subunit HisH [Candidatus Korobacteraceae bacterium]
MIAIVDYGAGNLASVVKAVRYLGRECVVTCDAEAVLGAEKLIIPGVGNFHATLPLSDGSVGAALRELIATQKPVLGICLGLQWMFEGSEEASELPGLGVFPGKCVRFSDRVKSPHVGWDRIAIATRSLLLRGIPADSYVYFSHSYWAPSCPDTVATCAYEVPFTAAVERDNLFGVQFHPEKSGDIGMKILENFCAL